MTEENDTKIDETIEIKSVPIPHKDEESIGEILKTILIALGIAVLLRIFIFQPFNLRQCQNLLPPIILSIFSDI